MFHRIGAAAYKANLDNTWKLSELLHHPEKKFKSVHVAGTNGKGSVSHALAAVLQASGYKTGLYTSPHLVDFRERIRINGKMISRERIIHFIESYQSEFEKIAPSFFEWTVALAFDYFAEEKVDIAIIETGLGGRLDSTNIVIPELSIITNISFDHQHLLGNTLEKIAEEKAGIIKENISVVIGEKNAETENVFIKHGREKNATIIFAEDEFHIEEVKRKNLNQQFNIQRKNGETFEVVTDLAGNYQQKNIVTVLSAIDQLKMKGWNISDQSLIEGLANISVFTGLQGRWQKISDPRSKANIFADVAHNEAGMQWVVDQLRGLKAEMHIVIGFVSDKDIYTLLQLLPKEAKYYFCKANLPRALSAEILQQQAAIVGLEGNVWPSVMAAYDAAITAASVSDIVFVGGSFFVVGEVLERLNIGKD